MPEISRTKIRATRVNLFTVAMGGYLLAGGLSGFAGWLFDIPALTDWAGTGISIQPNSTLAVVAAGAALISLGAGWRGVAPLFAAVTLAIGAATLIEWLGGVSFGIDDLFVFGREWGRVGVIYPGRMGPPGSLSWTILGTALIMAARDPVTDAGARGIATALTFPPLLISFTSLLAYLYHADILYTLPRLTIIALPTATFIGAAALGVIGALPDREPGATLRDPSIAGVMARWSTAAVIAVPVLLGWVRIRLERSGLVDPVFGTMLRTVAETVLTGALLWWAVQAMRSRDRALRERERLLETVTGETRVGLVVIGRDGAYAYANQAYGEMFGFQSSRIVGRSVEEVIPPENIPEIRAALERAFRGELFELERVRSPRPGQQGPAHYRVTYQPQMDEKREVRSVIVVVVDITSLKLAEETLRDQDRRKDEFLATLSHELRNPLAPLRHGLDLLRSADGEDADKQPVHAMLERQFNHLVRLVDDLLDLARITRGHLELRKELVPLSSVILSAVELNEGAIAAAQQQLSVRLPDESLVVEGDRTRLAQVFGNLLSNAARYAGSKVTISIDARRERGSAVISVSDNGTGIPADMLPHVFEMFSRSGRSGMSGYSGLGIGLALVRQLVDLHGGEVRAHSEGPGSGTEFIVRLPLATARPSVPVQPIQSRPSGNERILVVDDNVDAADSLGAVVRQAGFDVRVAYSGAEALEQLQGFTPTAAIVDLGMPGMDGYELARRIRAGLPGVTLIALTGWGQEDDRRRSKDAGFDHHLVKPVRAEMLESLIARTSELKPVSS